MTDAKDAAREFFETEDGVHLSMQGNYGYCEARNERLAALIAPWVEASRNLLGWMDYAIQFLERRDKYDAEYRLARKDSASARALLAAHEKGGKHD